MTAPDPTKYPEHAATVDVKVINSSISTPWDGPGDGSATIDHPSEAPLIASVNKVTADGALWTAPAGNNKRKTWFSRTVVFINDYLDMLSPETPGQTCNMVNLTANEQHEFVLRWQDNWPSSETAPGPSTNLEISLYHDAEVIQSVTAQDKQQNGGSEQYPREFITYEAVDPGDHCLYVRKISGPTPNWIQLLSRDKRLSITVNDGQGSIINPAEINNSAVLTVGASDDTGTAFVPNASRGPAPEPGPPNERIKPDIIASGVRGGESATSFASPRVAGLAALATQALGDRNAFDKPYEIAQYLKDQAAQRGTGDPNNQWGHGLAMLPGPTPPENFQVEHLSCNAPGDTSDSQIGNVRISFDETTWPAKNADGSNVWYESELEGIAGVRIGHLRGLGVAAAGSFIVNVDEGTTYQGTAHTCTGSRSAGTAICGPPIAPLPTVEVPYETCPPMKFRAVAGDRTVSLRWSEEAEAVRYDIEVDNGETAFTSRQSFTFSNLTNGTGYRFRVRSIGPHGTSKWTDWERASPTDAAITLRTPTDLMPTFNLNYYRRGPVVRWFDQEEAGNYEVRIWDGAAGGGQGSDGATGAAEQAPTGKWKLTPAKVKGWDELYTSTFIYGNTQVLGIISNLIPGTRYAIKVRAINGEVRSRWSEATYVTSDGRRPEGAPNPSANPPSKMPPSAMTATVTGQSVRLAWTAHTHPHYVKQFVWRRVVGSDEDDWTVFAIGLNDTTYTDTTVQAGTEYIYRIRGQKANKRGGVSNAVTVQID